MGWWVMLLAACEPEPAPQELTVLAAASLAEAYAELEAAFEAEHPDVDVVVSLAGSQALAAQIRHGIAADVFASANVAHITALAEEGLVGAPSRFAQNTLVLAVPAGAPLLDLASLPSASQLVVGAEGVPVGDYTEALLDAAEVRYGADWREAVESRVVSRELSVRLVASKVGLGEADAAVVYSTDAVAVPGIQAAPLPPSLAPRADYLHAPILGGPSVELAPVWLSFVSSEAGQAVLADHGFLPAAP